MNTSLILSSFILFLSHTHSFIPHPGLIFSHAQKFQKKGDVRSSNSDDTSFSLSNSDSVSTPLDSALLERAKEELSWERLYQITAKPVLNLSRLQEGPLNPSSETGTQEDQEKDSVDGDDAAPDMEWEDGSLWGKTYEAIIDNDLFSDNDSIDENISATPFQFIEKAPQLLRLEPSFILKSYDTLLEKCRTTKISHQILQKAPIILTFPSDDLLYGFEFLYNMMGGKLVFPNQAALIQTIAASPKLLVAAIEGGIQERIVSQALGDAGNAAQRTNQRIVGEAMSTIKGKKGNASGLSESL